MAITHLLADEYNLRNGIYEELGDHRHHKDFNKRNNNPINLCRLGREEHIALHSELAQRTLQREDVLEKLRKLRQTPEYKEKVRRTMLGMRAELSKRARQQWDNEEYKRFMIEKFLEFYHGNEEYRNKSKEILSAAQKKYWSSPEHRIKQSTRTKEFYARNPEKKNMLAQQARVQWDDAKLRAWRKQKTSSAREHTIRPILIIP
jgi:DNA gyrase subunit B